MILLRKDANCETLRSYFSVSWDLNYKNEIFFQKFSLTVNFGVDPPYILIFWILKIHLFCWFFRYQRSNYLGRIWTDRNSYLTFWSEKWFKTYFFCKSSACQLNVRKGALVDGRPLITTLLGRDRRQSDSQAKNFKIIWKDDRN